MRPLDVLVYFDYREHMDNAEGSAQALIDFVKGQVPGTYSQLDGIPDGFSVVRIAEPLADQIPKWYCLDSGETLGVDAEMLSKIIRSKNRLVPTYRRSVDRVWLLIASSFWEFASNFYIPREVEQWRFDFDFDKVLLLSYESGVFNLQKADKAA